MSFSDVLSAPQLYQAFQSVGGFFGARLVGLERHLQIKTGQRVIDIGCGPGHIVKHIPSDVDYLGFDTDARYIDFATKTFGGKNRRFFCKLFDDSMADEIGPADVVMMNGVLHHIADADVVTTLKSVARALKPDGRFFTLDGVYVDDQSKIARYLLDHDRGKFVRTESGYRTLLEQEFATVDSWVHHDLSRVPYSFFVSLSSNKPRPTQNSKRLHG